MAWNGIIATGWSNDGYGEYDCVTTYHIQSTASSSLEETIDAIKSIAQAYCVGEVESGWDMPYDFTWGDVLGGEIPDEVFESAGITIKAYTADLVLNNDEIVVMEMMN